MCERGQKGEVGNSLDSLHKTFCGLLLTAAEPHVEFPGSLGASTLLN